MNNTAVRQELKHEKFTIEVTDHAPFPNLLRGGLITSTELMEKISELFSAAYKDFAGCYVAPRIGNGFVGFDVKLYFCKPAIDNNGATYAFELISDVKKPSNSLFANLVSIEKRTSQRLYQITPHGREGLVDFLNVPNGKEPDWSKHLFEEMQNSNINSGVYAVVTNLDINKILSTIYGKEENGEYLQYLLTPVRPLGQNNMQATASTDWLLQLQRIALKELERVSRKVGIIQNGGIPMIGRH